MRLNLTLFFTALTLALCAQNKATYKDFFMEGSYLLLENQNLKALNNFKQAFALDSLNANINYMMGISYLQTKFEKSKAEYYLEKAVKNISKTYKSDDAGEKAAAPLSLYFYGEALHLNYKFDEAIASFEAFRKYVDQMDIEYLNMINRSILACNVAKEMVKSPINVQITNLGDSVNSPFPEYSPVLSADERTLIYTTRRPNSVGGLKTEDDQYYEDIVISYKDDSGIWSGPVSLSSNVNSSEHEASINLTPEGQTLIVYKNEPGGKGPEGNGNIYYTTFDGKDWSALQEFGSDVNSLYMESHACLNADGSILFFASERPGGYGGKDIYRCIKLPNGKWSKALNMGPEINSEYDEDGGFMHPDGQTFFFASNGKKSMGGYDIMFATLNEDNKFSNATNIGYPINTTDDDVFYVTSPDGKRGYFSSANAGGFGNLDLYRITIAEARESFLALFKGQIIPAEGEKLPDNLIVMVTDKQTNEIVGSYRPRVVNGTFSTILPPGKEYNFSYQTDDGEEFYNEDVYVDRDMAYQEINREVNLEPVRLGGKVKVKQKSILLNVVVLNNIKSKTAVKSAQIILMTEKGEEQTYKVDQIGKYEGIVLQPDRIYKIYATADGRKSSIAEISTIGSKSAKLVTQVLYLEGKQEKFTSKELLLDVLVKHSKTKKPLGGSWISMVDEDGEKRELATDADGSLKGIELMPETKYELLAHKDGFVSEKESIVTGKIHEATKYSKSFFIDHKDPALDAFGSGNYTPGSYFEFHFNYGNRIIDESDPAWPKFAEFIKEKVKQKGSANIIIKASASNVPTRMRGGNAALSELRAKRFESVVLISLKANGVDMDKVRFTKVTVVGGPKYRGDWKINRAKYQKHQYVKALVK
jgi:hypothetical protein